MNNRYILLFIALVLVFAFLKGCDTFQIRQIKAEKERLQTENLSLSIENEALIAAVPDTVIDTTIYRRYDLRIKKLTDRVKILTWRNNYLAANPDTIVRYLDTLDVSAVLLTDTLQDSILKMWYVADIFGNLNGLELGYQLTAPRQIKVPAPYPVHDTVTTYPKWGLDIIGIMQPNDYAAGIQFRTNVRFGFGFQYWFNARAPGISLTYQIK